LLVLKFHLDKRKMKPITLFGFLIVTLLVAITINAQQTSRSSTRQSTGKQSGTSNKAAGTTKRGATTGKSVNQAASTNRTTKAAGNTNRSTKPAATNQAGGKSTSAGANRGTKAAASNANSSDNSRTTKVPATNQGNGRSSSANASRSTKAAATNQSNGRSSSGTGRTTKGVNQAGNSNRTTRGNGSSSSSANNGRAASSRSPPVVTKSQSQTTRNVPKGDNGSGSRNNGNGNGVQKSVKAVAPAYQCNCSGISGMKDFDPSRYANGTWYTAETAEIFPLHCFYGDCSLANYTYNANTKTINFRSQVITMGNLFTSSNFSINDIGNGNYRWSYNESHINAVPVWNRLNVSY
jgi:hypothetical protein